MPHSNFAFLYFSNSARRRDHPAAMLGEYDILGKNNKQYYIGKFKLKEHYYTHAASAM
jgi:hypothetical protein